MRTVTLKLDAYSAIVLTIIAIALIANFFKSGGPAIAQSSIEIADPIPVNIVQFGGQKVNAGLHQIIADGLPVEITNPEDIECNCR